MSIWKEMAVRLEGEVAKLERENKVYADALCGIIEVDLSSAACIREAKTALAKGMLVKS